MKAWEIKDRFGLDQLRQTDRPEPQPGPGQVQVRVHACALNYRDYLTVIGDYNPRYRLPLIPLSDGAGEVVAVGEGVARVAVGDRVMATFSQAWTAGAPTHARLRTTLGGPLDGLLAEYTVLDQQGLVKIPEHLSFEQAATLPCAALTAWSALTRYRQVQPGDRVLLQGTGGVSLFGLQFVKLLGATAILTSSSDAKLARARELGADHLINYRSDPDWHRSVRTLTDRVGVDHVVEVGGADTLQKSLACVRVGGFVAVIGVLGGKSAPIALTPILMSSITVQGITVGSRDDFEAMLRAIETHRLEPILDRVFGFNDAPAAFRYLASGQHFGKVVIRVA